MKMTSILIAVLSLALVLGVVAWEWSNLTSPGPLHPSHEAVRELRGMRGCVACHSKGQTTMSEACIACHQPIKDQLADKRGVHGALGQEQALGCASCHSEHTGGRVWLVSDRSFQDAGIDDPEKYDHHDVPGFALNGRHDELKCEQCHTQAREPALAPGEKRFLGRSQDCVSCHADAHEGSFGADCASCHGQAHDFKKAEKFTHTTAFELSGAHARPSCEDCHAKGGAFAVREVRGKNLAPRECVACHKDPHEGSFGRDCASCHGVTAKFDVVAEFKHTKDFPLLGGHEGVSCKACHEKTGERAIEALKKHPLPVRGCVECHASPHTRGFIPGVAAVARRMEQDACTHCHSPSEKTFLWPVAKMTPAEHAASGFTLARPHEKVECVKCHEQLGKREPAKYGEDARAGFVAFFPGRAQDECASCHKDPHKSQFSEGVTHGRCVECHAQTHFNPPNFDLAAHQRTKFPLTGSHTAVGCAMCHKPEGEMRRFVPTPTACAECHKDVHAGAFDARGKPRVVDGRTGCERCHTSESFRTIAWTSANHGLWTGYDLRGAHEKVSCAQCHTRRNVPDERGMTLAAASKDCSACHADPHAGQFRRDSVVDCARCHTEDTTFKASTFDHDRDSRFKLDENHAKLACDACHKPARTASGVTVVRYRPLGTRCEDCHGSSMRGKGAP